MAKLLQGDELEKRAIKLGVDIQGPPITQSVSGRHKKADDFENYCNLSEALLNTALTVKNWDYEKEVRVISESNGLQSFESQAIQIVILGLKVTEEDEDTIRSLLASNEWKHVKIYKAIRGKAALKIEIVDG